MSDPKRDAWLDFFGTAPESLRRNFGPALKILQENPVARERAMTQVRQSIEQFDQAMPNPQGKEKDLRDSMDYLLRLFEESD